MFAVVSHDAGGAEVLSSYVLRNNLDCCFVLDGPALSIFKRKLGCIQITQLDVALNIADTILCGSSWPSDLEWRALQKSRILGKSSIVFLDHWSNYEQRFIRRNEICLPDKLWVSDKTAYNIVQEIFPGIPVDLVDNPYFRDLECELSKVSSQRQLGSASLSVLYVCEPKREHGLSCFGDEYHWGYVEEDALRYFLNNLNFLRLPVESIVLRPHPSELPDKYDWVQNEFSLPILRGGLKPLISEIAESDVVIGCESMALVIALLARKHVISVIPPGGKKCILPYPEIESLQSILNK